MGTEKRAPADVQWEAQFPSSQTSTAELCYLDGVLVRLRETRTHHLQEVPRRLHSPLCSLRGPVPGSRGPRGAGQRIGEHAPHASFAVDAPPPPREGVGALQ